MDENRDHSVKLKEENAGMREKLKEIFTQFQQREEHVSDVNKQMDLQKRLTETQVKKMELEFEAEKEFWKKEKSILMDKFERSEQTNQFLQENVKTLQSHLEAYQKQFTEFENTIKQSNSVSSKFLMNFKKIFFKEYWSFIGLYLCFFIYIFHFEHRCRTPYEID